MRLRMACTCLRASRSTLPLVQDVSRTRTPAPKESESRSACMTATQTSAEICRPLAKAPPSWMPPQLAERMSEKDASPQVAQSLHDRHATMTIPPSAVFNDPTEDSARIVEAGSGAGASSSWYAHRGAAELLRFNDPCPPRSFPTAAVGRSHLRASIL